MRDLGELPDTCILITLYTNIPNYEGLQAAMETLCRLMEMVLTKNNFRFNGVNFLQVGGTAMGTKVAPSYAVNYMGLYGIRR